MLGRIDLDPASSVMAQEKVRADRFFTIEDNGLRQEWHGNVWLNPPYAKPNIALFASKMVAEFRSGRVKAAVMLTHNFTDTKWFHELLATANAICFTRGRIGFVNADGAPDRRHKAKHSFTSGCHGAVRGAVRGGRFCSSSMEQRVEAAH